MEKPFVVNIDCSKILNCKEATQYTMLIDKSKMTIVFEFIEWIRWIFSADDCFYLVHNNSVIHELEDINILSQLKTFEIKPCGQLQCIHKKLYRKLLNNIKFFVQWNNFRVPRYFFDKITHIEQKIIQQSSLFSGSQDNVKTCVTQSPKNLKNNDFLEEKTLKKCRLFKETSCSDLQGSFSENNLNGLSESCQDEIQCLRPDIVTENLNINSKSNAEQNERNNLIKPIEVVPLSPTNYCSKNSENFNLRSSLLQEDHKSNLHNNLKFNVTEGENKLNGNLKLKNPKSFNNSKRHIRPFSIGELVTNIREKLNEKNYTEGEDTGKPIADMPKILNSNEVDEVVYPPEKRKRKRTRNRGNRNKLFVQEIFEPTPCIENEKIACTTNNKNCLPEVKPNHIRFNIDDSDSDGDKNFIESDYEQKNKNSNASSFSIKSDTFKISTVNKEVNGFVSDNTQLFSPINNQNLDNKLTSENLEEPLIADNEFQNENLSLSDKVFLKPNGSELVNFESNNEDINALMLLKEKFPSPVVIERFYDKK